MTEPMTDVWELDLDLWDLVHKRILDWISLRCWSFDNAPIFLLKIQDLGVSENLLKFAQDRQEKRQREWSFSKPRGPDREGRFLENLARPRVEFYTNSKEKELIIFAFALNKLCGPVDEEVLAYRTVDPEDSATTSEDDDDKGSQEKGKGKETNMSLPIAGRRPQVHEEDMPRDDVKGCWWGMKLTLLHTIALFTCRTTLPDWTFDRTMGTVKTILNKSQEEHETRYVL